MTAVNIKGTFAKDNRDSNGLEAIAEQLAKDEFGRTLVVGIVQLHKIVKEPGEAPRPTVELIAVEPVFGDDEAAARKLLDAARTARNQGPVGATLFDDDQADDD